MRQPDSSTRRGHDCFNPSTKLYNLLLEGVTITPPSGSFPYSKELFSFVPDPGLCTRLHAELLAAGLFTQADAHAFVPLVASGSDAQVQFLINGLRVRFQSRFGSIEDRKSYVSLLARLVKSFHFQSCFFHYPDEVGEFVVFAESVGPRLRPGWGRPGTGPPPGKVSVQAMIDAIRTRFAISDEEALYIRHVTEEKAADPLIRGTVHAHRDDRIYLDGAYRGQVNGEIQVIYKARARYEELADPKYTDTSGIFDLMAFTLIQSHLAAAA